MVLTFNEYTLLSFKEKNPNSVILIADETKNPGSFMGSWDKVKPQNADEINELLEQARNSKITLTNWGIRVGTNEYWGADFEWSWIYRIWVDKIGSRAETLTIQTANGGKRPVYLTTEVNQSWGEPYKNNLRFEIKNKGYVILGGTAIDILGTPSEYKIIKNLPVKRDDTIIKDTLEILKSIREKSNFLDYNCIKTLDKKMRMDHDQRLAILNFMLHEDWPDLAIHNFFMDVHEIEGKKDYKQSTTQTQINSGRSFIEKGGKPKPCTPKKDGQTTLYQLFNFDPGQCFGCLRRSQEDNPLRFFQKKEFIPQRLSDDVQRENKFIATDEKSDLRYYNEEKGIWEPDGKEKLQSITIDKLKGYWKSHYTSETEKHIRYSNYVPIEKIGGPLNKIVVQNGVYNLDLKQLEPFDPDIYAITALPIKYDVTNDCPKIIKFLSEVVSQENIQKILEIIGYCLYKSYPLARIFIFTGTGRNGKSVLINLITQFLGPANTSSVDIQNLTDDSFRSAELFGKLANINGDLPPKPIKDTGLIKKCTGQDPLTVAKKYQQPFQFYNHAKLIFAANQIPRTYDNSDAMHRRLDVIEFPNKFESDDPKTDPNLLEKLITENELSGLFNRATDALERLLDQGRFSNETSIEERKLDYIKRSDPVHYFALTYIQQNTDPEYYITKSQLYDNYVYMCRCLDLIPTSSNWFSQNVKRYVPYLDEGWVDKDKVWRGISVKFDKLTDLSTNDINGNTVGGSITTQKITKKTPQQELKFEEIKVDIVGNKGNLPPKTNATNATNDISSIVNPSDSKDRYSSKKKKIEKTVGIVGGFGGKEYTSTIRGRLDELLDLMRKEINDVEELSNNMGISVEGVRSLLSVLKRDGLAYELRPGVWFLT